MIEQLDAVLTDLADLPPVGTSERREWDRTVREADELYPDWAWITVGKDRLRRQTYEQHYRAYREVDERPLAGARRFGSRAWRATDEPG
jgi:hypothetical protein